MGLHHWLIRDRALVILNELLTVEKSKEFTTMGSMCQLERGKIKMMSVNVWGTSAVWAAIQVVNKELLHLVSWVEPTPTGLVTSVFWETNESRELMTGSNGHARRNNSCIDDSRTIVWPRAELFLLKKKKTVCKIVSVTTFLALLHWQLLILLLCKAHLYFALSL